MRRERLAIVALLLSMAAGLAAQSPDYRAGGGDVLTVTVWNQPTLSGRFTIEADGTFAYPLLGRVAAAGLTIREIEAALTAQLAVGFVKDPQVRATIEQHRSQRVLVLGEVKTPGSYPLTRATTFVEVLALAGSTTPRAGSEAIVIRGSPNAPAQLPGSGQPLPPDISRIRLDDVDGLEHGRTFLLCNGDLVFVPPAPTVHVFGEVRNPGEYPLKKPSSVLQVLAVAGGLTDRASKKDLRVVRIVDGKSVEQAIRLDSDVAAGDIIIVRARLF